MKLPTILILITICLAVADGKAHLNRRLDAFDFGIAGVTMDVSSTDPANWGLSLSFAYYGPSDASATVHLLDKACEVNLPGGIISTTGDPAVQFGAGQFVVPLAVNVQAAQDDTTVLDLWTQNGDTQADLAFCARVDLVYGAVFVNFAKTKVSISADNVGDFTSFQGDVMVSSSVDLETIGGVTLGYELEVYSCDAFAQPLVEVPAVTPGTAVRVCVSLKDPANFPSASVSTVKDAYYDNAAIIVKKDIIVEGIAVNLLSSFECSQVPGVCLIEFIPDVGYFVDEFPIEVSGSVDIAFSRRRRLRRQAEVEELQGESASFVFLVETSTDTDHTAVSKNVEEASSAGERHVLSSLLLASSAVATTLFE